jgi:hypothetical protein
MSKGLYCKAAKSSSTLLGLANATLERCAYIFLIKKIKLQKVLENHLLAAGMGSLVA